MCLSLFGIFMEGAHSSGLLLKNVFSFVRIDSQLIHFVTPKLNVLSFQNKMPHVIHFLKICLVLQLLKNVIL